MRANCTASTQRIISITATIIRIVLRCITVVVPIVARQFRAKITQSIHTRAQYSSGVMMFLQFTRIHLLPLILLHC